MPSVSHVVLLKYKATAPPDAAERNFKELEELTRLIPGLLSFQGGPDRSVEGLAGGHTHGFVMVFRDAAARDAYLPHPEHERVKQSILPWVEGVTVVDFENS